MSYTTSIFRLLCVIAVLVLTQRQAAAQPSFKLPFPTDASATVTQSWCDECPSSNGHCSTNLQYAIDFALPEGTHLLAAAAGTIWKVVNNVNCSEWPCDTACPDWGNYIIVDHGNGWFTRYAHLQYGSVQVAEGERVCQGKYLGRVGSTGCSTNPHLHFQVQNSGTGASVPFGGFSETAGLIPTCNDCCYVSENDERVRCTPSFVYRWGTPCWLDTGVGCTGNTEGQFAWPRGLAVDSDGNLFVVDGGSNHRVQKFNPDATFNTMWGSYGTGLGQFKFPIDVAVDSQGMVYVVETDDPAFRVQKFTNDGSFVGSWGAPGGAIGQFWGPRGVGIDGNDLIYIADTGNYRVQVFDTVGSSLGVLTDSLQSPQDVAIGPTGDIYVTDIADGQRHRVVRYMVGGGIEIWGSYGHGPGEFTNPSMLCVDNQGNVLVTDTGNNRVQMFTADGEYLTEWGTSGCNAMFINPQGVAVDSQGRIYVADMRRSEIKRFESQVDFTACTPTGANVTVQLGQAISTTFQSVEIAGESQVTIQPLVESFPFGTIGVPAANPVQSNIATTAEVSGDVEVCITYSREDLTGDANRVRLMHYGQDAASMWSWSDITTSVDSVNLVVCGVATSMSPFAVAESTVVTGIDPEGLSNKPLLLAVPNPFSDQLSVSFQTPEPGKVSLHVYDVAGRLVRTLLGAEEILTEGAHTTVWNGRDSAGRDVSSGIYILSLRTPTLQRRGKVLLIR